MKKRLFLLLFFLVGVGCDKKVEDKQPDGQSNESLLRLEQISEQFNAKLVSEDLCEFHYTADLQDFFSDPNQNFVLALSVDDILKQKEQIIAKCLNYDFNIIFFLNIDQEMYRIIRAENNEKLFFVVSIDRIYKPFFGLTGNVEGVVIKYAQNNVKDFGENSKKAVKASFGFGGLYDEQDYEEAEPIVIDGCFYIEVCDAPTILFGKCKHIAN